MRRKLRVLVVEDSEKDALLLLRELRQAGFDPVYVRVDTAEALTAALGTQEWDVVLADYVMPTFDGLKALEIVRQKSPDLPFIIISGNIGEDIAVAAMVAGANDYIMKGKLKRLAPAIERELAEAENRKERKRVEAELREAEAELRALTSRLVQAQEEERRSIARELHDQTGQYLTLITLQLDKAMKSPPDKVVSLLQEIKQQVYEVIRQVRDMSLNLRPSMLDDLGLLPALIWLIDRFGTRSSLHINFEHENLNGKLPAEVNTVAYRIIQEALTNVVRHASATEVIVKAQVKGNYLLLSVKDNGCGVDLSRLATSKSTGVSSMRERARALGGQLRFESSPGAGTSVTAELPIKTRT